MRSRSIRWAVGAVLVLSSARAVADIIPDATVVIQNAHMRMTFQKAHKDADTSKSAILIRSIENLTPANHAVLFDTTMSNIFSIEFRSIKAVPVGSPIKVPAEKDLEEVNSIVADGSQLGVTVSGSDPEATATLTWNDIEVTGTPQTFDAIVTVRMRPDGKAEWDITATVTPGDYGIYAVRFPYLANRVILPGREMQSRLLTPLTGGMKFQNPVNTQNRFCEQTSAFCPTSPVDEPEGTVQDAFFTYPGNMMTQFMAYYDPKSPNPTVPGDRGGAGIYMAAEDQDGYTKNLYFDSSIARRAKNQPNPNRLRWYFTHFNTMPSIASGATEAARKAAFETFTLSSKLHYPMVTDTFIGDWVDAAQIYRRWVIGPPAKKFVALGTLRTRAAPGGDLAAFLVNTGYAYRRQLPIDPTNPAFPEAINPSVEYAKDQGLLRYYDNILGNGYGACLTKDFTPLIVVGQYQVNAMGQPSFGEGDHASLPLRTGVAEWLWKLKTGNGGADPLRISECALNFDTAGLPAASATGPEALLKAVMRTTKLAPMFKEFDNPMTPADEDYYRTCFGSSWLLGRRDDLIMQTIGYSVHPPTIDIAHPNGIPGISMAALSGQGNFSFACYAPWDAATVSAPDHDHPAGGGKYLTDAWKSCSAEIRSRMAATYGQTSMLMGLEHEPETLIPDQILVGRSFAEPYDNSQPGVERALNGSEPVPLFKILYHDYGLWPAKVTPFAGVIREYMTDHDDYKFISEIMNIRYRIAQLAMQGRLLVMQVSQDPRLVPYEGFPGEIKIELQDEHAYFAAMAALRLLVPQYLIFGRGLRDPGFTPVPPTDTIPIKTRFRTEFDEIDVPRVVGSAWRDTPNDTVGLVFTNYTPDDLTFSFDFKLADYGLKLAGATYSIEETRYEFSCSGGIESFGGGPETWMPTGMTFTGDDDTFTSGPITVPGAFPCGYVHGIGGGTLPEPWRTYRVVRTN